MRAKGLKWPFQKKPGVRCDEQEIVSQVAEMGHSTLASRRIKNRHRNIDAQEACPSEAHGKDRIEIKSTRPLCVFHHFQGWSDGIKTEAEKRIFGTRPKRLQRGEEISREAPEHTLTRRIRPEDRHPANKGGEVVF